MSDPALIRDPAILEAAARAQALLPRLEQIAGHDWRISFLAHTSDTAHEAAQLIRELLKLHIPPDFYAPLIRAAALEEAARVAEDEDGKYWYAGEHRNMVMLQQHGYEIAAAIRARKEQP